MPAVLPLMRAALRSSTRRRSSTPPKRREAPSIPAAGQNVACKSPTVSICVEELLIFGRAHSVARKRSFAGTWHYIRLSVHLLWMKPAVVQDPVHLLTRQALLSNGPPARRAGSQSHEIRLDSLLESYSCRGRVAQLESTCFASTPSSHQDVESTSLHSAKPAANWATNRATENTENSPENTGGPDARRVSGRFSLAAGLA